MTAIADRVEWITLREAAKLIPGTPPLAKLNRWAMVGVRGVKLKTMFAGGRLMTTAAWVAAFLQELNPGLDPEAVSCCA